VNSDVAIKLGTPLVASVVFGAAGAAFGIPASPQVAWSACGGGMVLGWVAGQWALIASNNQGKGIKAYNQEIESPRQSVVFNIAHDDGYVARVAGGISWDTWRRVAKTVVEWRAPNLTTNIVSRALPWLVQADQRAIHQQIVGLLSGDLVGVINSKANGHNEITRPVGWSFFARVADGRISPFSMYNIPHNLQSGDAPQSDENYSTHTRHTRELGDGWVSVG